ncbi:uncharacterized protein LOC110241820 [Exaiptasia diaphana]|uniref:OTU domain-containing protein n=1 Tax=Exaiptasia diaphana TaxID=2652724 RepID=A0A913XFH1_EXADI|nr:uncharacterized protein LOC110241820 [Exaiptasia diaphana]KXJ12651.1 hypothetical protein AC249_AIPGENE20328 [Exaiptasia diaphana]
MKNHYKYLYFMLPFFLLPHYHQCVILGEEESKILEEVVEEFKKSPTDSKYDHVVHLPINKAHLIPKVFIWCPLMHYNIALRCPVCNSPLKVQSFAKAVNSLKSKERAPRLIYDIGGNILLIQTYYICLKKDKHHAYMSATSEILQKLPRNIAKRLPFILHYKSGFSNDLLDFLLVSVNMGHTFQEVTELIATMNYRKFVERNNLAGVVEVNKSFQDNILYSFTSGDKLMHVFLCDFDQKKEAYKKCLNSVSCNTLVIDTSYKMEKKCKVKGPAIDSFQEMHLDKLFLGLNENGEVVLWKPIKAKGFEDIKDALLQFKHRLDANNQELNTILASDCCVNREAYQQVFPTVVVKMGIVHAIKSVTDTLPKEHPDTMVFAHKLLQIFSSSTSEDQRSEETVSPLEIEANLDILLTNWRSQLSEGTMDALDTLRQHIRQGCLSGIPPGEGTEKIDALHRYIHKSFLARVTVITPQMAFAIFTCLVYAWNCKKQCKDLFKGKKVIPVMPIEAYDIKTKPSTNDVVDNSKIDIKALAGNTCSGVEPLVIECYLESESSCSMLVITADVLEFMFIRLLHIQDLINAFKEKCQKSFGVSEIPIFSSSFGVTPYMKVNSQSSEQDINSKTLHKNLAEYGLQLDKVPGDGNCLFRSIVCQIEKLKPSCPELRTFLESLGMGKTQDEDTTKLRELFVSELQTNFIGYKDWIDVSNMNFEHDLKKFSEEGFFASDIGDLCIKVCANVLQVPIIVIPSLANVKFIPFLPSKFTSAYPVYIAYNHSAPGHYDATNEIQVPNPGQNKCRCGRRKKYSNESSTISCDPKDTRCPCVLAKLPCVYCQCFNCQNKPVSGTPLSCRCNTSRKRNDKSACLNKERASCCCAKAGLPCTTKCYCNGCGNGKPEETQENVVDGETPRKKRKGYKLKPALVKGDSEEVTRNSEWTEQELICLMVCKEVLDACNVEQNVHNVSQVYSYIAKSKNNADLGLSISVKDQGEIQNKLQFLRTGIPVVTDLVAMTTNTVMTA